MASSLAALKSRVAAVVFAMIGLSVAPAYANVGVTSGTDGDPLGRPPSQAERVLRVGINIQANEFITTKADDRAHIVFLDGTSLTVAPNAELVIDKYVYDPNSKTGEIAVSVSKGVLRLVGGRISKTVPMVVNTPSSTIGIRGGIAVIVAEARQTQANFLFGVAMTATANGRTETATRPGSQIVTRLGQAPGLATIIPPGGLTSQLATLEGHTGRSDRAPDEAAKQSGFSSTNSGQAVVTVQPATTMQTVNRVAAQAVSNATAERQPFADVTGTPITTLSLVSAIPQGVQPPVVTPPTVLPTPVVTTPVGPTQPTPTVVTTASTPSFSPSMLPSIQKPASTSVTGVGSGSLTPPTSTPTVTAPKPTTPVVTTPTTGGPTTGGPTTVGPGRTTTGLATAGPSTTPVATTPTTTTTNVVTVDKKGATPAVGVGNGGLIPAIPVRNGRR